MIAIDGACRRNGKPDCVAAGGAFVQQFDTQDLLLKGTATLCEHELGSTNQRGEMLGLLAALRHIAYTALPAQVITDSEYLFNAMTKGWFNTWMANGWRTASGGAVKNQDLWEQIVEAYLQCVEDYITFYHIKGHTLPFGRVTANTLLSKDPSGKLLYNAVTLKYDSEYIDRDIPGKTRELSEKNNGFAPDGATLRRFVIANTVADAVATHRIEEIETRAHSTGTSIVGTIKEEGSIWRI